MSSYYHILLIEDDQWLLNGLSHFLQSKNFHLSEATTLAEAKAIIEQAAVSFPVQLIIADVSLPDGKALSLFDELYNEHRIGKIFISASTSETDRIKGLKTGADDYLCKPVNPEELLLRVKAVLRRLNINCEETSEIRFLHYRLNPESRLLTFEDKQVRLSKTEHQLLIQLVAQQGKIVSRELLSERLDNKEMYQQGRALDILISRLRKKMLSHPAQENPIVTYREQGYMLLDQV